MLDDVLDVLACPHCGSPLSRSGNSVRCVTGHAFDIARQGYVSLLRGDARTGTADTSAMVAARERFLDAGHYAPILRAVESASQQAVGALAGGCAVDVGAGTGHYLAEVLERLPAWVGVALDVSKYALRRAARAHPRAGAVACDVWRPLPVRDGAASLVLNIFAPRNPVEIHRILRPEGALIVVTPAPGHLGELVSALGLVTVDKDKQRRLHEQLDACFTRGSCMPCAFTMTIPHEHVATLVRMGPSAWHTDPVTLEDRIGRLPNPVTATAAVKVSSYRPR